MDFSNIAQIVHYYRKQSGLTQRKLAQLAGIGKTSVFDIENGKTSVQLNTILKVLDVLNIKIILKPPFMPLEN